MNIANTSKAFFKSLLNGNSAENPIIQILKQNPDEPIRTAIAKLLVLRLNHDRTLTTTNQILQLFSLDDRKKILEYQSKIINNPYKIKALLSKLVQNGYQDIADRVRVYIDELRVVVKLPDQLNLTLCEEAELNKLSNDSFPYIAKSLSLRNEEAQLFAEACKEICIENKIDKVIFFLKFFKEKSEELIISPVSQNYFDLVILLRIVCKIFVFSISNTIDLYNSNCNIANQFQKCDFSIVKGTTKLKRTGSKKDLYANDTITCSNFELIQKEQVKNRADKLIEVIIWQILAINNNVTHFKVKNTHKTQHSEIITVICRNELNEGIKTLLNYLNKESTQGQNLTALLRLLLRSDIIV